MLNLGYVDLTGLKKDGQKQNLNYLAIKLSQSLLRSFYSINKYIFVPVICVTI